jgi:hypothetical protein
MSDDELRGETARSSADDQRPAFRIGAVERNREEVVVLSERVGDAGVGAGCGDDRVASGRAVRAMSTPVPRPAPVMEQTCLSVMVGVRRLPVSLSTPTERGLAARDRCST